MEKGSNGSNWTWVTHYLAIFLSVVCMGLVVYTVIWVDAADVAKTAMGFSTSILGVILGFYFNRERLAKESLEKDYFSSQYTDLLTNNAELRTAYTALIDRMSRDLEGEPEEE
jgi:hypothetical protein